MVNKKRIQRLNTRDHFPGPVVYWMSRDQRVRDNWSLLFAQEIALKRKQPLLVIFCLVPCFLGATIRQYGFMLKGLQYVETDLEEKQIPFFLFTGTPENEIDRFLKKVKAGALVTDFDPLHVKQEWKSGILKKVVIPFYEVDAHNIVPCREASQKKEYAAYTIRPKIRKMLPEFLVPFPRLKKHPYPFRGMPSGNDWEKAMKSLKVDRTVPEVSWVKAGETRALRSLRLFIKNRLVSYETFRNDPVRDGQSNLSPYLHFGQISAQRIALEVKKSHASQQSKDSFLEELIIRRELSDNFCFYTSTYDSFEAFPDWAKKTLSDHRKDRRRYLYSLEQFEKASSHDELWNAAQREMVKRGKMHGFMRMYWAKKILEWTETPEQAMETAIYLNDKYQLDGRDPNGYAGIAWSIGGVHDRAWNERPIFGKIRYMSYNGCKSKFTIQDYIQKVRS